MSIEPQCSPSAWSTGPDSDDGQRPVAARWASAQARICSAVSGWLRVDVRSLAVLSQQLGQRSTAGQAAAAHLQSAVEARPGLEGHARDRTGRPRTRPAAVGGVMGVGPGQDQVDRQAGGRAGPTARRRRGRRVGNCSASQARRRSTGDSGLAPCVTPRSSASSMASDDPPGCPRRPRLKAVSIADQDSSSTPQTGPEPRSGHCPVAVRWASAQRRTRSTSSALRLWAADLGAVAVMAAPIATLRVSRSWFGPPLSVQPRYRLY